MVAANCVCRRLHCSATKFTEELTAQVAANAALAAELDALCEAAAASRRQAEGVRKEAAKLQALQALTTTKIEEAEAARAAAEEKQAELKAIIDDLDDEIVVATRALDSKKAAANDARREKDVLARALAKAGDKTRESVELVELQQAVSRNLSGEIASYVPVMRALREEAEALQAQRSSYAALQEEAQVRVR